LAGAVGIQAIPKSIVKPDWEEVDLKSSIMDGLFCRGSVTQNPLFLNHAQKAVPILPKATNSSSISQSLNGGFSGTTSY